MRGAVERHYRLRQDRAVIGSEVVRTLTAEDHRQAFATAMTALLAEFTAYLDRDRADPVADRVGYRQHALWLSPAELEELIGELRAAIAPKLANQAEPRTSAIPAQPHPLPARSPSDGTRAAHGRSRARNRRLIGRTAPGRAGGPAGRRCLWFRRKEGRGGVMGWLPLGEQLTALRLDRVLRPRREAAGGPGR